MRKYLLITVSFLFLTSSFVFGSTITSNVVGDPFTGYANWNDVSTWVGGQVPGSADDVIIVNGAYISIYANTTNIKSLEVQNGGNLGMVFNSSFGGSNPSLIASGSIIFDSGSNAVIYPNSGITAGTFSIDGADFRGSLTVNGNATFTGSFLARSTAIVSISGSVDIQSGGTLSLISSGTVGASFSSTGVLSVNSGGTLSIAAYSTLNCTGFQVNTGASSVTVNGTLDIGTGSWISSANVATVGGTIKNFSSMSNTATITLTSDATLISGGSIDLSTGGTINVSSGKASTITLTGNFICKDNTSFSAGNSTIKFEGGSGTSSGTSSFDGGTGTGTTVYNITSSMTTSGTKTINLSGVVNLSGTLTLSDVNTSFNIGSSTFTLISNNSVSQTSKIAALPDYTKFSGNVIVQRYLPHGNYWNYLALPLQGLKVYDLIANGFQVTGHYAGNVSSPSGLYDNKTESIYIWNAGINPYATAQSWLGIGWNGPSTDQYPLSPNIGYSAYDYNSTAHNLVFAGSDSKGKPINAGQIDVALFSGFNLIPNPYPSPIAFNNFKSRSGLGSTVYLQVDGGGAGNVYASTTGSGVCANCTSSNFNNSTWLGEIAMGQSFWVTASANNTLSFQESDKTTTSATFAGKTSLPENYVRVSLVSGEMKDETLIFFSNDGSNNYNPKVDGLKRANGFTTSNFTQSYINISTSKTSSNDALVFNYLPFLNCESGNNSIILNVNDVISGNHSLVFTDLETFTAGYKITLVDKYLKTNTLVTNGYEYKFNTTDNVLTFGSDRFELKFESTLVAPPTVTVNGNTLNSNAKSNNQWYKNGKPIPGATNQIFEVSESGSYTVKLTNGSCTSESLPVILTITAAEGLQNGGVTMYPNPTNDVVKVVIPSELKESIYGITLTDSRGSLLMNNKLTNGNTEITIDLSDYPVGLYILNLKSNVKVISLKIIKK